MEAQARFSSDASHELRTPLAALRAHNEVEASNPQLTVAEARKVMRSSIEQTIKLEQLSDGLLQLSRGETGGLDTRPVPLDEIVSKAINQVIPRAQSKRISIHDEVADVIIRGDIQSLIQAATILLDNAVKYSNAGSTIRIKGYREGKAAILSVQDNGIGIAKADLPHIFERFYRADNARTKQGEHGYGLGLSIAQKIIEHHNGKITVQSIVGKGTTFTIKLPPGRMM
jgi:signal transduction histidine kinase